MNMGNIFQSADWKTEKHVPVIDCPAQVRAGELCEVRVSLGKEVAHPNTTEHHIRWVQLFSSPMERNSAIRWAILNSPPMANQRKARIPARFIPITRL